LKRKPQKDRATLTPTAEDVRDPNVPGRPWWGLYAGDSTNGFCWASGESSMLVVGPPRSGKTSCIVIPAVLDAPAAVVSTSTKTDVLEATVFRRWSVGNCYVFDPTGTMTIPSGAYPLRWSPVVGSDTFEKAVAMARALASAARPRAAFSESAHWVERAEGLLAPLLFTANLAGRDMTSVCRWVISRDVREPLAALEGSGHEMAHVILGGVLATEERERSGIFSTAAGLLSAYRSDAALATTIEPNFDPVAFARSTDAVYICAPSHAQEQLTPIVVALLEQIRDAVYARPAFAAPVVFALDEVASIAPLASLPAMAAEGGGQGLRLLACLQDLSQARARWGEVADGFFSLFNQKLIFPGIGDQRTLGLVSALGGEQQVQTQSLHLESNPNPLTAFRPRAKGVTYSTTWRPRLPVDKVARGQAGHSLAISGSAMAYTAMVRWFEHWYWSAVARANSSLFGETVRPELPTTAESVTATRPSSSAYDGPTIYSDPSGPRRPFIWIANGSQSPERQFGPPQVLQRVHPSALGVGGRHTNSGSPVAQSSSTEPIDNDDEPVTDDIDVAPSTRTEVRILGPVEVAGWRVMPDRPILTELVCYLALHRDRPISSDGLRAALRPDETNKEQSAKTLRTYLSMLRKSLGPDVLPNATSAGYQLAATVITDWDHFRRLSDLSDLQSKLDALKLVRGRPFEGVSADSYLWVFTEFWISDIEVAVVAQAKEAARLCRQARRSDDALLALRQGLLAVRSDFTLWDMYLAFASEAGEAAHRRAQLEARAALGDDSPC
jgi:type IV secretion system protein VirD4